MSRLQKLSFLLSGVSPHDEAVNSHKAQQPYFGTPSFTVILFASQWPFASQCPQNRGKEGGSNIVRITG